MGISKGLVLSKALDLQEFDKRFQNVSQGGDQSGYVDSGVNTQNVTLFPGIYLSLLPVGYWDGEEWGK